MSKQKNQIPVFTAGQRVTVMWAMRGQDGTVLDRVTGDRYRVRLDAYRGLTPVVEARHLVALKPAYVAPAVVSEAMFAETLPRCPCCGR